MATSSNIQPFILKWEGGLSRSAADNASSYPAPWAYKGLNGWHTNKGVTYRTFVSSAATLGYAITAENFFNMPSSIWAAIFKKYYWDSWYLDQMDSQAIADFIANASWGSGPSGSFQTIKKYLATKNITVTTRLEAVKALNKLSFLNETAIFLDLIEWRAEFFRTLEDYPVYGEGWLNRNNALKVFGLETIAKKKSFKVIAVVAVFIMAFIAYKILK